MADLDGVRYLRTTRGATVLYGPDERVPRRRQQVLRRHDHDQVTIVAAGITVHTRR